jgi:uncharacterized protein (DUF2249 family)
MTEPLELDVRPILRDGGEPFGAIMEAVDALAPGQQLRLISSFRPEPLFSVMAAKGFGYQARTIDAGTWEVVFTPLSVPGDRTASHADDPDTWPEPSRYLDCTELDMPQSAARILARLEALAVGEVIFVLLGREPVFLYSELQARGHAWVGDFDAEGTTYRLMVRAGQRQ